MVGQRGICHDELRRMPRPASARNRPNFNCPLELLRIVHQRSPLAVNRSAGTADTRHNNLANHPTFYPRMLPPIRSCTNGYRPWTMQWPSYLALR
jgi:hypothetical protein